MEQRTWGQNSLQGLLNKWCKSLWGKDYDGLGVRQRVEHNKLPKQRKVHPKAVLQPGFQPSSPQCFRSIRLNYKVKALLCRSLLSSYKNDQNKHFYIIYCIIILLYLLYINFTVIHADVYYDFFLYPMFCPSFFAEQLQSGYRL